MDVYLKRITLFFTANWRPKIKIIYYNTASFLSNVSISMSTDENATFEQIEITAWNRVVYCKEFDTAIYKRARNENPVLIVDYYTLVRQILSLPLSLSTSLSLSLSFRLSLSLSLSLRTWNKTNQRNLKSNNLFFSLSRCIFLKIN